MTSYGGLLRTEPFFIITLHNAERAGSAGGRAVKMTFSLH